MKSKDEVLEHLKNVCYTKPAMDKILGFLIGNGYKEESERIVICLCDGVKFEWSDFWEWFNDECDDECILCSLMADLCDKHNEAEDEELKKRYKAQIDFLAREFEIDEN